LLWDTILPSLAFEELLVGTALTSKWFFLPVTISCPVKLPSAANGPPEVLHHQARKDAERGLGAMSLVKAGPLQSSAGFSTLIRLTILSVTTF